MAAPQVTAGDRLGFTLFLALAVHGVLLFGVGFAPEEPRAAPNSLDVTLAMHRADDAPEEADFIAQANQVGSGTEEDKSELTTTEEAPFSDPDSRQVQLQEPTARQPTPVTRQKIIVTRARSERDIASEQQDRNQDDPRRKADQDNVDELSREIASLQARLDKQKQAYAKRPRVRRLTSVSAKAHYEAAYIEAFRRKVEATGTRHFPRRALDSNTFGGVRLMVALRRDGGIEEVEVLQSSGHDFLDQAAVQSVRLAAPFEPFTQDMRERMDVLEIIRTWKFDANRRVSSK
ncbi:MAG: TonB family protein [Alloalcanivorax venustensis]|jgi:protein TonB|uniref:TonB n=1 Tax=Alloalcanivorax venustensis ISO4 TaxID=1177184 RepID=A0ABS0AK44_9GAMM|nr:TonB family protein [Alloalcanivorax venustensis]MAQ33336.1 energy transducer TonB [Alcanivorax sp.]MCH9784281.1 TonB family protein [Gammaproteobacteria bacterium]MEA3259157.1 TonB family protein [Pseudomonadota bacterium]SMO45667.1 protein TonB [Alcanivorax sp. DSM 26295]MBF5054420.1 TonB [Alloalcanivorax venustensis ISO4]|tara:strand:+ start:34369 stop:35238 length:870 start_codon:yes stop_codon:yes gene_type:complete